MLWLRKEHSSAQPDFHPAEATEEVLSFLRVEILLHVAHARKAEVTVLRPGHAGGEAGVPLLCCLSPLSPWKALPGKCGAPLAPDLHMD